MVRLSRGQNCPLSLRSRKAKSSSNLNLTDLKCLLVGKDSVWVVVHKEYFGFFLSWTESWLELWLDCLGDSQMLLYLFTYLTHIYLASTGHQALFLLLAT